MKKTSPRRPKKSRRPRKSSYIGVYLEDGVKDSVERMAVTEDVSTGQLIRKALRLYMEQKNPAVSPTA
jgi:hypothetical protein